MSSDTEKNGKITARFSHMGLVVKDIDMMEDFYTNVIGFERTDGGMTGQGVVMIFMTLDPDEHHQVFLVEGRPDDMPTNTIVPGAGGAIHHLAQPFLKPMDFNIDEDELMEMTEKMCREAPGFQPIEEFYGNLKKRVPVREKENA